MRTTRIGTVGGCRRPHAPRLPFALAAVVPEQGERTARAGPHRGRARPCTIPPRRGTEEGRPAHARGHRPLLLPGLPLDVPRRPAPRRDRPPRRRRGRPQAGRLRQYLPGLRRPAAGPARAPAPGLPPARARALARLPRHGAEPPAEALPGP